MPRIVPLPGAPKTPPRKRRGRTHEAVLAAYTTDTPRSVTASLHDRPHVSYNPDNPLRVEHGRHLNARARARVGIGEFAGHYHEPASLQVRRFVETWDPPEME